MSVSKAQIAEKKRQAIADEVERTLIDAAPAAAKKLADWAEGSLKLGREDLGAINVILERLLGKTGTTKAPDPAQDKTNELLSELARIRAEDSRANAARDAAVVAERPQEVRTD